MVARSTKMAENASFEIASKYFFLFAGVVTALGTLPTMLSPAAGLSLTMGLTYFEQSPQVAPIIGHWGIMVVGIGVLLLLSATNKQLRKTTILFSTIEKAYMVSGGLYCFVINAPYAGNYIMAIIGDGSLVIGGLWYLWQSRRLGQL